MVISNPVTLPLVIRRRPKSNVQGIKNSTLNGYRTRSNKEKGEKTCQGVNLGKSSAYMRDFRGKGKILRGKTREAIYFVIVDPYEDNGSPLRYWEF